MIVITNCNSLDDVKNKITKLDAITTRPIINLIKRDITKKALNTSDPSEYQGLKFALDTIDYYTDLFKE